MEPEPPGAAFFTLEPEPTQVGRSRSRLRDLGHLEPAPQYCRMGQFLLFLDFHNSASGSIVSKIIIFSKIFWPKKAIGQPFTGIIF